jgi:6-phosphogluconolactonase/glucosamine-6-phosphate isomerase/deaminase
MPLIRRFADPSALVEAAAADLVDRMAGAIAAGGACRVALAGGSTPRVPARSPKPPVDRVSLSLRAINEAPVVRFWVTGEDKAARLAEVFREIESGTPAAAARL